ncbi:hypothetical protein CCHR01_05981 [Colletotrichum chrysophilum]|uniref:Uncharacterized protein n=1 Tax=Colletotrichum chrysophilum TaxID=1836956 RepID=A0AAD9ATD1_9PEZI|nr:hypothetical protein CCHR01_05981 [Colletotrichum chrysophilum]
MDVDGFAGFRLLQTGSPLIWESQVGLQMFAQLRTLKCDYARRLCASFAFALTIWRCYWSDTPRVLDPATPWLIQLHLYNVKETVVHAASGLASPRLE